MRILAKVSNLEVAKDIMNSFNGEFITDLCKACLKYRTGELTILIRAAYVLGNLTTKYNEVRRHILRQKQLGHFIKIAEEAMKNDQKVSEGSDLESKKG